jgi:hypothetical protein
VRSFFWSPAYKAPDEDELIAEVLRTAVGDTAYPGDVTSSPNWPGVAPGRRGSTTPSPASGATPAPSPT